ncbi:MAG: tetratricopeptide repeat protein [Opitutae bacterium]|nr:tetratricopeptide repeat protein [Opitutae bacterium]
MRSRATARLWLFRGSALLGVPVLFLAALEFGLWAAGYGRAASFLIPDREPGYYRASQDYVSLFMPESFDLRPLNFRVARQKPANTLRVVVLGESAVQGTPAPAFGFVPQLRAQLQTRHPDRRIEVINTGVVAINSHVVYQIARDLAAFAPDLFVVYLGNNEVVGPYGPGCAYLSASPPLWVIRASVAVRSTRSGQLLAAAMRRLAPRTPPADWGGMSMFVEQAVAGDDPRLEAVCRNFEANLRAIVRVATGAGAKTLLCTVVANLKDSPPFLSRHRAGLAGAELAQWQAAFDRGRIAWLLDDHATARPHLTEARRLDPQYADTLFMLGSIELRAGNEPAARALLVEALRWDALRFRPDPSLNEIIRRVGGAGGGKVGLVDTAHQLGADLHSTAPIAGRELLFEHVHFDWEGNYRVARAMAEGAEALLFGTKAAAPAWLDSAGCAAALGYTPQARPGVLQRLAPLVQSPPFPNQLTYPEDMARFNRDLAEAQAASRAPGVWRRAQETIAAASARDPGNPALAKLEEEMADDLGDRPGALAAAQRARSLQPDNYAVAGNVAIKLMRLGRHEEAEKLLRAAAAAATPREQVALAPAFGDLFARTRRPEEHRRHLDALLARQPDNADLHLLRAQLARSQKDHAAAERDLRAILGRDPGHQAGLEALVALLDETGQTAAAEQATLAAVDRQSRNLANNLRAAILSEQRGDDEGQIRFLRAAERSGMVTSGVELRLARKLLERDRPVEALAHLAEARRISLIEGDAGTTAAIEDHIRRLLSGGP